MTDLRIMKDLNQLVDKLTQEIVMIANEAIATNGRFSLVLSGGSTPRPLYENLAVVADQIAWEHVHIFFGDERTVPPESDDSNYHMAKEALLDHVPLVSDHIHRMQGEITPHEAATRYNDELLSYFGQATPSFDFVLLGMGDDAHTASLFPHTAAIDEHHIWVIAHEIPKLNTWRITLTPAIINQAHYVAFMVDGANKAPALAQVLQGDPNPAMVPSQIIAPAHGILRWFVTESAVTLLK